MKQKNKSSHKQISLLAKLLVNYTEEKEIKFILQEEELVPQIVFLPSAILPVYIAEAKEIYDKLFNQEYTNIELLNVLNQKSEEERISELSEDVVMLDKAQAQKDRTIELPVALKMNDDGVLGCEPILTENKPGTFFILSHICLYIIDKQIKLQLKNEQKIISLDDMVQNFQQLVTQEKIKMLQENSVPQKTILQGQSGT